MSSNAIQCIDVNPGNVVPGPLDGSWGVIDYSSRPDKPAYKNRDTIPTQHEIMVYHTMAEHAVSSKMYKGIGDKAAVMMIMLAARELGIPPMQALNKGINMISGGMEISARMMGALIRKAGHKFSIKKNTADTCVLWGKRCDTGEELEVEFTVEEAKTAGIFKAGGAWTKWPKDMTFARALSRLARQLFSDVIGIGYVEGELRASETEVILPDEEQQDRPAHKPEIQIDNESAFVEKYLQLFDKDDRYLAMEYLETVKKHFDWTVIEAINALMKDPKLLIDKFCVWVNKKQKVA